MQNLQDLKISKIIKRCYDVKNLEFRNQSIERNPTRFRKIMEMLQRNEVASDSVDRNGNVIWHLTINGLILYENVLRDWRD